MSNNLQHDDSRLSLAVTTDDDSSELCFVSARPWCFC